MEFTHTVRLSFLLILMLSELVFASYLFKYPYYSNVCLNLLEWIIRILVKELFVCFHFTFCCFICIYFINCFDLCFKYYPHPFYFFLMIFTLIIQRLSSSLISSILSFVYSNWCFIIINNCFVAIHFIVLLGFLFFYLI
jgi:hypothetical protein